MLDQRIARDTIDCALATGGDFAEIFFEDRVNNAAVMRSGKTESVNSTRLHGAGIRIYQGFRSIYGYTNDTSREGLLACARKAAGALRAEARTEARPLAEKAFTSAHPVSVTPSSVTAARKIEKMRAADAAMREEPEVVQTDIRYSDSEQNVWIANSEGLFVHDTRVYTRLYVTAVASNGTENQTGREGPGGLLGFEAFDRVIDPQAAGRKAARRAVTMLHAPVCPAGIMPVVIENGFGGVIFHEACGHSLEATSVATGASEFSGRLGQQIAASCVTAFDDGTLPNAWGSENVDDEGTPTGRLVLIENGILKNYMIDRLNARRMGMPVTGSARRQDYSFAPTSRMRNTYIAAGSDDNEEMIATMGDGLYAASMGGGSVNPATGEFNFSVEEAYLVKDGKILHPVRGASLIGRGSEMLLKIDRVGPEMKMAQGMCGSLSGSVPTNVGQPRIRVGSITVGGR